MRTPIWLLTPNNCAHKAGDGTKTRKREVRFIHPALQANCGATQATYLLERWTEEKHQGIIQIGNLRKDKPNFANPQCGRVYSIEGISPTINTCQGGEREPKVIIPIKTKDN